MKEPKPESSVAASIQEEQKTANATTLTTQRDQSPEQTGLAPCPFCGSEDVGRPFDDGRKNCWITCNVCSCDGPLAAIEDVNAERVARTQWNQRAPLTSSGEPQPTVSHSAPKAESEGAAERQGQATLWRVCLETLKENRSLWASLVERRVRIWQGDHGGAWWRPPANGYTTIQSEAAVYDFEDAWSRCSHCGPEKQISFEVLPLPSPGDNSNVVAGEESASAGNTAHEGSATVKGLAECLEREEWDANSLYNTGEHQIAEMHNEAMRNLYERLCAIFLGHPNLYAKIPRLLDALDVLYQYASDFGEFRRPNRAADVVKAWLTLHAESVTVNLFNPKYHFTYADLFTAFEKGALEARQNPDANLKDFKRSADAYCKLVHQDRDPEMFAALSDPLVPVDETSKAVSAEAEGQSLPPREASTEQEEPEFWKQDGACVLRKSDGAFRFEAWNEAQAYNAVMRHNSACSLLLQKGREKGYAERG